MEISIYSTIDFSKSRNLLTERQKSIKAFSPIVPKGGCISLLELNPKQYATITWTLINQKTGKITETTADSSDSMHYVAIPESLRFGNYKLKVVTTWIEDNELITETTISNPFEFVEASEDVITIVSRNQENDLVGNVPQNVTILQPIYVNPLNLVDLADVDIEDLQDGQVVTWNAASNKFKNVEQSGGDAIYRTITIAVADWAGGTTCTKTVTGVTATTWNDFAFAESCRDKIIEFDVRPSGQGFGTITFTADSTPDAEIVFIVQIQEV